MSLPPVLITPLHNSTESKYMSLFLCSVVVLSCFSYLLGTMDKFKCVCNSTPRN